jgi:hypothetical protein
MKTREEAEVRALELYPNTHIATVNHLHEVSRDAFLQCWDEMQVPMSPQEAKERALELYPIHPEFDVDRLKPLREAYLQGWDDSQVAMDAKQADVKVEGVSDGTEGVIEGVTEGVSSKQTCGFCVEPATELTNEKHSESIDTKEDEGSELHTEKQEEVKEHECQYCGVMTTTPDEHCYKNPNWKPQPQEKIDEILNSKIIKPKQIR